MAKIKATYSAAIMDVPAARHLDQPKHLSQVRLAGSFQSIAAFKQAADAAHEAVRSGGVVRNMILDGEIVEALEPGVLYVTPMHQPRDLYVRLDEVYPKLRDAAE